MEGGFRLPQALSEVKIQGIPESAYYVCNFLSKDEEDLLLEKINGRPAKDWTVLSKRRLQTWPSKLSASNKLIETPLPAWLAEPVVSRLIPLPVGPSAEGIFSSSPHGKPNHCLINEYLPGQGIMPHTDGPAYQSIVATVSLGSHTVLDVYARRPDGTCEGEPTYRILQEPRSLLITTDKLYSDYLHGIAQVEADENLGEDSICNWSLLAATEPFKQGSRARQTRVSLTFRDVKEVVKVSRLVPGLIKS